MSAHVDRIHSYRPLAVNPFVPVTFHDYRTAHLPEHRRCAEYTAVWLSCNRGHILLPFSTTTSISIYPLDPLSNSLGEVLSWQSDTEMGRSDERDVVTDGQQAGKKV